MGVGEVVSIWITSDPKVPIKESSEEVEGVVHPASSYKV